MSSSPALTAHVLVEALPYIQRFRGKTVVVKLGGAAIDRRSGPGAGPGRAAAAQRRRALRARPWRRAAGRRPDEEDGQGSGVPRRPARHRRGDAQDRAHGAGRRGQSRPRRTINRETLDDPVAVGVAGEDGGLLVTTPRDPALGFVGDVSQVRAERLHGLLDQGLAPVVSTVGADPSGQPYNINADEAAMAIAVAMAAEKIVYLTAAPGLLEESTDETAWSSA